MQENLLELVSDKALEALLVFFGFIGMVTPLALWVAWSEFTFYLVLGIGVVTITAFVLLSWFFNARHKARHGELPKKHHMKFLPK